MGHAVLDSDVTDRAPVSDSHDSTLRARGRRLVRARALHRSPAVMCARANADRALVMWLVLLPLLVYVASVESLSLFLGLPTAILVAALLMAATHGRRLIAHTTFPALLFGVIVIAAGVS